MDYTENYNLKKPAPEDYYNIADFNENADVVDEKLLVGENALTLANELLTRVKQLETNYTALAKKARVVLTIYGPVGCIVRLVCGSSNSAVTLTSSMETTVTIDNVGTVQAQFSYNGVSYVVSMQILNAEHRYVAAPIPLEDAPWAYIAKASEAGLAQSCWQVGDTKTLNVNGEAASVRIMGFEHDSLYTPEKYVPLSPRQDFTRAGITFGLVDVLPTKYQMHATDTEDVLWSTCDMRLKTLPALLATLDSELQAAVKTVRKITPCPHDNTQNYEFAWAADGIAEATADQLFTFSEYDIFGAARCSTPYIKYEEQAYEYYRQGGAVVRSDDFWLRGTMYDNSAAGKRTLVLKTDNTIVGGYNDEEYGLTFGFCV